jgi:hypothetical protein
MPTGSQAATNGWNMQLSDEPWNMPDSIFCRTPSMLAECWFWAKAMVDFWRDSCDAIDTQAWRLLKQAAG